MWHHDLAPASERHREIRCLMSLGITLNTLNQLYQIVLRHLSRATPLVGSAEQVLYLRLVRITPCFSDIDSIGSLDVPRHLSALRYYYSGIFGVENAVLHVIDPLIEQRASRLQLAGASAHLADFERYNTHRFDRTTAEFLESLLCELGFLYTTELLDQLLVPDRRIAIVKANLEVYLRTAELHFDPWVLSPSSDLLLSVLGDFITSYYAREVRHRGGLSHLLIRCVERKREAFFHSGPASATRSRRSL